MSTCEIDIAAVSQYLTRERPTPHFDPWTGVGGHARFLRTRDPEITPRGHTGCLETAPASTASATRHAGGRFRILHCRTLHHTTRSQ